MIHPAIFLVLIVLGAVGVCLALPRGGRTVQVAGALLAGLAGGLLMLFLGLKTPEGQHPNIYFYVFSAIALGGALRVITHPRPVYAALYFILTVLSSAGLFLILSAEFMAFALVIVYAGAILITYLFVIMLATQAPEEGQDEVLEAYDTSAREPVAASVVGFVLLGALSVMMFRGAAQLPQPSGLQRASNPDSVLRSLPRKVEHTLRDNKMLGSGETVASVERLPGIIEIKRADGSVREIAKENWPENLRVTNTELLGFNLLREHPGTIEIAGVILLMAMLGAVVLSRKQVQLDEDAKAAHVTKLARERVSADPVKDSPLELVNETGHLEAGLTKAEGSRA